MSESLLRALTAQLDFGQILFPDYLDQVAPWQLTRPQGECMAQALLPAFAPELARLTLGQGFMSYSEWPNAEAPLQEAALPPKSATSGRIGKPRKHWRAMR